jgi:predicted Zn-dependent protease
LNIARPGSEAAPAVWLYQSIASAVPVSAGDGEVLLFSRHMPGASLLIRAPGFAEAIHALSPQVSLKAARLAGLKPGLTVGALAFALAASIYAFDLSPSKGVARMMPETARERLGEAVLRSFADRPVCADARGAAALESLVARLMPDGSFAGRVKVLDWQMVNAFATPGRRIVLTRAIIQRAASADELAGVLAHEIGHGLELHPEAGLVRSVGFWALVQMVFTGTPGAIGNAGTLLLQLAYTRTSEREADDHALAMLKRAGISPKPFSAFFRRMEGERPANPPPASRRFGTDLLSTHPNSPERIAKIENQAVYPTTPALSDEQWRDVKGICGGTSAGLPPPAAPPSQPRPTEPDMRRADARIAANPDDAFAWQARAALRQRAGDAAGALADYDEAVKRAPNNYPYRYQRGRLHAELGNSVKALEDLSAAVRLNPEAAAAFAARGDVHRRDKRHAQALADYNEALRISPQFVAALYGRGQVRVETGDWPGVLADFSAVLAVDPKHASARVGRGLAFEQLGQRENAIAEYRAILVRPPAEAADQGDALARARARLAALGVPH